MRASEELFAAGLVKIPHGAVVSRYQRILKKEFKLENTPPAIADDDGPALEHEPAPAIAAIGDAQEPAPVAGAEEPQEAEVDVCDML